MRHVGSYITLHNIPTCAKVSQAGHDGIQPIDDFLESPKHKQMMYALEAFVTDLQSSEPPERPVVAEEELGNPVVQYGSYIIVD